MREGFEMRCNVKANYLLFYLMLIIFIHYVYLPPVTIGVDVTIESLEENEKLVRRYVLLVKEYGVFDTVST